MCNIIVVGMIAVSKDVHALTPGICGYISFCGKRDFVDVIKDMHLQMATLAWIIWVGPM